jgi:glyoxylase-like metal-dependent hydrolase (beta-lactamase superfamily II)
MGLLLPKSDNTVRVWAIDTTTNQVVDARAFIEPVHKGHETLNLPTLAFLVEHEQLGRRVLFDCGGRKDYQQFSPGVLIKMDEILFSMRVDQDIDEILEEAGIALETIDSMIWSHWHFDHHGAPDHFPKSVEIVVGPGFKDLFMPGFPTRPDAILSDVYFEYATNTSSIGRRLLTACSGGVKFAR